MLTRMIHVTLKFDPKDWAKWADSAGIDKRGIAFVLNHPETVTFKRTTPRTLEQFFRQIENIEDLQKEEELVRILGMGTLDDTTVGAFCSFVRDDLTKLIDPEDILEARDFSKILERIEKLRKDKEGNTRTDRISAICTRLFLHLIKDDYVPGDPIEPLRIPQVKPDSSRIENRVGHGPLQRGLGRSQGNAQK